MAGAGSRVASWTAVCAVFDGRGREHERSVRVEPRDGAGNVVADAGLVAYFSTSTLAVAAIVVAPASSRIQPRRVAESVTGPPSGALTDAALNRRLSVGCRATRRRARTSSRSSARARLSPGVLRAPRGGVGLEAEVGRPVWAALLPEGHEPRAAGRERRRAGGQAGGGEEGERVEVLERRRHVGRRIRLRRRCC